jgi:hypothetical protein
VRSSDVTSVARRPLLWPWVVVLSVGIVMGAVGGGVFAVRSFSTLLNVVNDARLTPTTFTIQCETGTYEVLEQGTAFSTSSLTPADVKVTGPGGQRIATSIPTTSETRLVGGRSFFSVVSFDTPVGGAYRVRVAPAHGAAIVVVAPSFATSFRHNAWWLAVALLGIVPFLLGAIMVIVRAVQRSRRRPRLTPSMRCANGHPAAPTDRFCASCGAAVYPAGTMVHQQ